MTPMVELTDTYVRASIHSYWMRLDLGDAIQNQIHQGTFEPTPTAWISQLLGPGHRFVDIGANCGYYTALASQRVGQTGRVFSFEPSPVVAGIIADMIAANGISNIELVQAAVGADNDEVEIYLPSGGPVHSPSALFSDPTFVPIRVPMIALDKYAPLNNGKAIDCVKIDVEGFEPNVIDGMKNLIRNGLVKNLICEFNSGWLRRNAATPSSLLASILDLGLSIRKKTKKTVNLEADGKTHYDLQDIWFSLDPPPRRLAARIGHRINGWLSPRT